MFWVEKNYEPFNNFGLINFELKILESKLNFGTKRIRVQKSFRLKKMFGLENIFSLKTNYGCIQISYLKKILGSNCLILGVFLRGLKFERSKIKSSYDVICYMLL